MIVATSWDKWKFQNKIEIFPIQQLAISYFERNCNFCLKATTMIGDKNNTNSK